MQGEKYLTFFSNRKKIIVNVDVVLYAIQDGCKMKIHTVGGEIYETRMTLAELENSLGNEFIKIKRNTLVRASAVESVAESVILRNGEALKFAARQKPRIIDDVLRITARLPGEDD